MWFRWWVRKVRVKSISRLRFPDSDDVVAQGERDSRRGKCPTSNASGSGQRKARGGRKDNL